MKSVEATNNLVATALMIKLNSTVPIQKEGSAMIASAMAKRQGSTNKWDQFRGVAAPKAAVTPQLPQVQGTASNTGQTQPAQTTSSSIVQNQAAVPLESKPLEATANLQQAAGTQPQENAVVPASQEGAPDARILRSSSTNGVTLQSQAQVAPLIQQEQSMLQQTQSFQTNQAVVPQQVQQQRVLQQQQPNQLMGATSQMIQQQPLRTSSQMQSGYQTMQQQQQRPQ
jgi:hypothetical protein